jgi:hypothetical protein
LFPALHAASAGAVLIAIEIGVETVVRVTGLFKRLNTMFSAFSVAIRATEGVNLL